PLQPFLTGPASTEFYPLSLHDALPIFTRRRLRPLLATGRQQQQGRQQRHTPNVPTFAPLVCFFPQHVKTPLFFSFFTRHRAPRQDRKSTRLNSSHVKISYAVFCLKKKK